MTARTLIFTIGAALAASAGATDAPRDAPALSVQAHGVSYHFTRDIDYNERNPGLGIRYAFNRDWAIQAGAFNNSQSRLSVYGIADWTPVHVGAVSAGAFLGAATGYDWRPMVGKLTPVTGAVVRAEFDRFNIAVRITPPHPKASAVAALEFGIKF